MKKENIIIILLSIIIALILIFGCILVHSQFRRCTTHYNYTEPYTPYPQYRIPYGEGCQDRKYYSEGYPTKIQIDGQGNTSEFKQ